MRLKQVKLKNKTNQFKNNKSLVFYKKFSYFSPTKNSTMHVRNLLHANHTTLLPNCSGRSWQRSSGIRPATTKLPSSFLYSNKTHNIPRCQGVPPWKIWPFMSTLLSHRRTVFQHYPIHRENTVFSCRQSRICQNLGQHRQLSQISFQ